MSEFVDQLQAAIEQLYNVFARYPLRMSVEACPHCVSSIDNDCIHAAPLQKLSAGHLGRYAFKAITTWGSVDDFRHFLPRILELLTTAPQDWIDPEVVFGKLPYGKFEFWPAEEQAAVQQYCDSLWQVVCSTANHPFETDRCLCCIAMVREDLDALLQGWRLGDSTGRALQFAKLVESVCYAGRKAWPGKSGWWEAHHTQSQQVIQWLRAPERVSELESAFFKFSDDPSIADTLSYAFNNLYNFHKHG